MKPIKITFITLIVLAFPLLRANAVGQAGGLSLLQMTGARASALGEAYTSSKNDINGFHFNPASLYSLETGQAGFFFKEGLDDDAFGQIQLGLPTRFGGFGFSAGYYDGGDFELINGTQRTTVQAQTDLLASLGTAFKTGSFSFGVTGKYLSSELIETARAQAFAADFGVQYAAHSRLNLGVAIQNLGQELKFVDEGDPLPRTVRGGASYLLIPNALPTTVFLDASYQTVDQEFTPAIGTELRFGVMALRAGFRRTGDQNEFSIGSGFLVGPSAVDYAFAMLGDELGSKHQISLSMKFGKNPSNQIYIKKPRIQEIQTVHGPKQKIQLSKKRRIYIIKEGDSLERIAREQYGNEAMAKIIFSANWNHLMNPENIKAGQSIILP